MKNSKSLVNIFKALADKTRLEIVEYLLQKGEVGCTELSKHFSLSQPTMSHHYHKLEAAGILEVREEGVKHFYQVNQDRLSSISKLIKA